MSERVLYDWTDALGDEWQLIYGPRPMGMGFQRRSAGSGWEWVPSTPSAVPDLAKAMLGLLCETRRLSALYDGERLLRERESARLAGRVTELEAENAKLRACVEKAADVFRYYGKDVFGAPFFTDRYGDSERCLGLEKTMREALAARAEAEP